MSDDIFESVSQGSNGAYDEENRRIQEVSDELQRLCRLYEEKPRDGKSYGGRFEIEQRIAEQYAKSNGLWIPMDRSQRAWHRVMLFSRCQFGILKVHQVIKRGLAINLF